MSAVHVPVLIVGAGAAGLATSALSGRSMECAHCWSRSGARYSFIRKPEISASAAWRFCATWA